MKKAINNIIKNTVKDTEFTFRELRGRRRYGSIVKARHDLIYNICSETDMSFTNIGKMLDRTPATISYAFQKTANQA